jgi:hypothetical protein
MSTDPPGSSRSRERASSTLNSLVRVARDRNPTDEAIHRISDGLVTSGVFASPPPSFDATTAAPRFLHLKIGAGLLALAAGWLTVHSMQQAPDPTFANATMPSVASTSATSPELPAEIAAPPASSTTGISVDELPSATPPPAPARGGGPTSRSSSATAAVATPTGATGIVSALAHDDAKPAATELELVQRAQAALASDPQRALAITREQGRLYPDGEYVQEREVFAVEALSRLGQKDEAWQRAAALVQRFPRTPHAARLELATGRRLVPPASPSRASADITSR